MNGWWILSESSRSSSSSLGSESNFRDSFGSSSFFIFLSDIFLSDSCFLGWIFSFKACSDFYSFSFTSISYFSSSSLWCFIYSIYFFWIVWPNPSSPLFCVEYGCEEAGLVPGLGFFLKSFWGVSFKSLIYLRRSSETFTDSATFLFWSASSRWSFFSFSCALSVSFFSLSSNYSMYSKYFWLDLVSSSLAWTSSSRYPLSSESSCS